MWQRVEKYLLKNFQFWGAIFFSFIHSFVKAKSGALTFLCAHTIAGTKSLKQMSRPSGMGNAN